MPLCQLTATTARRYCTEVGAFCASGTQLDELPELTSQQVPRNCDTVKATVPGCWVQRAGPPAPCGAGSQVGIVAPAPADAAALASLAWSMFCNQVLIAGMAVPLANWVDTLAASRPVTRSLGCSARICSSAESASWTAVCVDRWRATAANPDTYSTPIAAMITVIRLMAMIDSSRTNPPSSLPRAIRRRMASMARRLVRDTPVHKAFIGRRPSPS